MGLVYHSLVLAGGVGTQGQTLREEPLHCRSGSGSCCDGADPTRHVGLLPDRVLRPPSEAQGMRGALDMSRPECFANRMSRGAR